MAYINKSQLKHFKKPPINKGLSSLPEKLVKQRRSNRKDGIKHCQLIVDKELGNIYVNKVYACKCKNGSCHKGEPLPDPQPAISKWMLL